jgi:cell shape-determining protein MreC
LNKEQYDQISSVIKSLFGVISESIKNYNTLNETMRVLKKELNNSKHEY